jgi:hypothetical protein
MRLIILFFSTVLLYHQSIFAQTKMDKIKHIQDVFVEINKTTDLKTITLNNEDFLRETKKEGGRLTGFFKQDSLVKIHEWIGVSYGTIDIDYYFEKGELVFAYVKENYFIHTDSSIDKTRLTVKFEGRFYFENGDIIAQKNSGSGDWGDTLDNTNPIFQNAKKMAKLLTERKMKAKAG